jgi:uncharacterized heparinase superfamily protein
MRKFFLYYNTLKFLKPKQFLYRLKYRLCSPRPMQSPAPAQAKTIIKAAPWLNTKQSLLPPDKFIFLNKEHNLESSKDWNNSDWNKLWLYNLHYFDWLRQKSLEHSEAQRSILRWIEENQPGEGNGWEPYTLSLRIVNWIKWALTGNELPDVILDSLAAQTRYLAKCLEYHILGNHLFANCKALIFAGLFFSGTEADTFLKTGTDVLRNELSEQILPDGGHFELSPMYHSIILEDVLDLINISRIYDSNLETDLNLPLIAEKMLEWLEVMTHPDGDIAFFNDAAWGVAQPPDALVDYAARLGIEGGSRARWNVFLSDSGYARLQRDNIILIADVGQVGPDYQPGHAHADTLSFELSVRGKRVLVNSGTSCYGVDRDRLWQRSTSAHNALSIDGLDSSEVWSGHRVARRARIKERSFSPDIVMASHDGFSRKISDCGHRRTWQLTEEHLIVTDEVSGTGEHDINVFMHLYPGIVPRIEDSNICVLVDKGKDICKMELPSELVWKIKESEFYPEFGKAISSTKLVGTGKLTLPAGFSTLVKFNNL